MSKTKWSTINLVKPVPFEVIIIFLVIYFEDKFCCGTIILSILRFSSKVRCIGRLGNGKIDIL